MLAGVVLRGCLVKVTALFSDMKATRFMQLFDVFEKGKVVLAPSVEITVKGRISRKNIDALKQQCESSNYGMVAMVSDTRVLYRNPDVRAVSDGKHWSRLDDYLGAMTGAVAR